MPVAILFDVFGTCVDWRTSVAREVAAMAARKGASVDALAFADTWRSHYVPSMAAVSSGKRPYVPLDTLHRETLVVLCKQFGLPLDEAETDELNFAWHRLDPWPDTVAGLVRLKTKYILSPLSNGNVRLLVDMAKRVGLPWDTVLSSEIFKAYKPLPATYLGAVEMLGCKPGDVMLTAAHNNDLRAAQGHGLMTAFVPRVSEYGPAQKADLRAEGDWNYVANNLVHLADMLGV
jgi:2-haloacid dehalogenase